MGNSKRKELCPECYGCGEVSSCCNDGVDVTMPTRRKTTKPDGTIVVSEVYYRYRCDQCKKLCKAHTCGYCGGEGYEPDEEYENNDNE